jgi:hypothetical protein
MKMIKLNISIFLLILIVSLSVISALANKNIRSRRNSSSNSTTPTSSPVVSSPAGSSSNSSSSSTSSSSSSSSSSATTSTPAPVSSKAVAYAIFVADAVEEQKEAYWKSFFVASHGEKCAGENLLRNIMKKVGVSENGSSQNNARAGPFWWIKEWGFGQASYLFDYLDPIFRDLVLIQFHNIYKAFKGMPPVDSTYLDPFDLKKVKPGLDATSLAKVRAHQKLMAEKLDSSVHDVSINAVQLHLGLKFNSWAYDKNASSDYAKEFIIKYDINLDGRLSPRELILASIWTNSAIFENGTCKMCYDNIVDQLDGVFHYMDCNGDGVLSAEEMFSKLPKMKRFTSRHNFFLLAHVATIRTAVINDFILKNMSAVKGVVNKKEFRQGVLLGFWDRQTDDHGIIGDDSRNLKKLRWEDDEITDTLAERYVIRNILARAAKIQALRAKAQLEASGEF